MSCPIRINAFLAAAGLGSRRAVENLIRDGQVSVNGQVTRDLATRIVPLRDRVECRGQAVCRRVHQYVMLHKPTGYACTRSDPHAAQTIYDLLPDSLHHLVHAGRLDVDSEGLLLLSNDGQWIARLTHPRHQVTKCYEVEVTGKPDQAALDRALQGIRSAGEVLQARSVEIRKQNPKTAVLTVTLREGRNREIRRIFGALHHPVVRLKRVSVGGLRLGDLARGQWRYLTPEEPERAGSPCKIRVEHRPPVR